MEHIWETIFRAALPFIIMMFIARILGKPTIAQMTYHEFVAAITLGALTANLAFKVHMSIYQLITAQLIFALIAYLLMIFGAQEPEIAKIGFRSTHCLG